MCVAMNGPLNEFLAHFSAEDPAVESRRRVLNYCHGDAWIFTFGAIVAGFVLLGLNIPIEHRHTEMTQPAPQMELSSTIDLSLHVFSGAQGALPQRRSSSTELVCRWSFDGLSRRIDCDRICRLV